MSYALNFSYNSKGVRMLKRIMTVTICCFLLFGLSTVNTQAIELIKTVKLNLPDVNMTGYTYGDNHFWILGYNDSEGSRIFKVDLDGNVVDTINLPPNEYGGNYYCHLVYDGNSFLTHPSYTEFCCQIAGCGYAKVVIFDMSGKVLREFDYSATETYEIVVAWDGNYIWAANRTNTFQIDHSNWTIIKTLNESIACMAWDGKDLWVSVNHGLPVYCKLSPSTGEMYEEHYDPVGGRIFPDGEYFWKISNGYAAQFSIEEQSSPVYASSGGSSSGCFLSTSQ